MKWNLSMSWKLSETSSLIFKRKLDIVMVKPGPDVVKVVSEVSSVFVAVYTTLESTPC
jgi:hypothetical protein